MRVGGKAVIPVASWGRSGRRAAAIDSCGGVRRSRLCEPELGLRAAITANLVTDPLSIRCLRLLHRAGRILFEENCSSCHGTEADGVLRRPEPAGRRRRDGRLLGHHRPDAAAPNPC